MNSILVATDGSEDADRAIDVAAELAKATASKLLVMTVGHELSGAEVRQLARAEGGVGEAHDLVYMQLLQRAKARALSKGAPSVEVQLGWGEPGAALLDTARRMAADFIVVGRRGRGKAVSVLLGSVSHRLVGEAPCVVVVVP